MVKKIIRIFKRIFIEICSWIKRNGYTFVLIICTLILLFMTMVSNILDYTKVVETFKTSVTVLISMLGFSVSIYVFLNNTLQNRRNVYTVEREMIELFQKKRRGELGSSIIFSTGVVLVESLLIASKDLWKIKMDSLSSGFIKTIYLICIVACIVITILNVWKLGHFTYGVINYEEGLKHLVSEERANYSSASNHERMNKGDFLNLVNNIEVLVERLVRNHMYAKTSSVYDSDLKRAVCDGRTDVGDICTREKLADDYKKIIEYRNLLLQDMTLNDSDLVGMGDEIKSVMNRLFQKYLKNELLTGICISNLKILEANLSKTSFCDTLLQNIEFKGRTNLNNTDFRDSTLNNIRFDETDCESINFSNSKLIDVKFTTKVKLHRAIFRNADLSNIGQFGPDDKEGTRIAFNHADFERANLTYLNIFNVSFDFANMSSIQLADSKIGVSAQKDKNTTFKYADMLKADLLKSKLERCCFQNANLNQAVFTYAQISNVDFRECRLFESTFTESLIEECNFEKIYGANMSLKGSKITDANFTYATITSADMSGAILKKVRFEDAVCMNALFINTYIEDSSFERCVLANSRFAGNKEKKTLIRGCNFAFANCSDIAISNIEFKECNFMYADFSNARLINVTFIDCVNLESVLTTNVWLGRVSYVCESEKADRLKKPQQGWRYCDAEGI